jgi:uridine nucleosidase
MSSADLDTLRTSGGRFCEYSWSICQFYKSYHLRAMGMDGIYLHDPTAFIAVIAPELFQWSTGSIRVAVEGVARGKTLLDNGSKNWVCENSWMAPRPKCRVALELDAPAVLAQILRRLAQASGTA